MNGIIEANRKIRSFVALQIANADNRRIPDGYADNNGFIDDGEISDWSAFIADQLIRGLEEANIPLKQHYPCPVCCRLFDTKRRLKRHNATHKRALKTALSEDLK